MEGEWSNLIWRGIISFSDEQCANLLQWAREYAEEAVLYHAAAPQSNVEADIRKLRNASNKAAEALIELFDCDPLISQHKAPDAKHDLTRMLIAREYIKRKSEIDLFAIADRIKDFYTVCGCLKRIEATCESIEDDLKDARGMKDIHLDIFLHRISKTFLTAGGRSLDESIDFVKVVCTKVLKDLELREPDWVKSQVFDKLKTVVNESLNEEVRDRMRKRFKRGAEEEKSQEQNRIKAFAG